tara:strand:+ start:236 stop:478 length:243 start_codon:yes stop_codon:yes gene_type:complete
MPALGDYSSNAKARSVYQRKYSAAHRDDNAARKRARRKMVKLGRARLFDGKDVDHRNGNPKDNKQSNLSMMGRSKNRSKH